MIVLSDHNSNHQIASIKLGLHLVEIGKQFSFTEEVYHCILERVLNFTLFIPSKETSKMLCPLNNNNPIRLWKLRSQLGPESMAFRFFD